MIREELTIADEKGLHLRPSQLIAETALKYSSSIVIEANGRKADAKFMLGLLGLKLLPNSRIMVEVQGEDEKEALEALRTVLSGKEI